MSFNLVFCAHYTLMDISPIVDLSRPLKTNLIVIFAPLWNVMRSCLFFYKMPVMDHIIILHRPLVKIGPKSIISV